MADDKNKEVKNKSNKAINEMLKKAYAELGYTEEKGGYTKFGKWYGLPTSDWCAMFVCWTVYQGFGDAWTDYISKSAIATLPRLCVQHGKADWVRTPDGENKMKPQPGDIWAVRNYGHTGMVYEVDGDTIVSIEGNHSNKVASVRRKISSMTCIVRPHWGVPANTGSGGSGVDLQTTIETLLSSDSYKYLDLSKKEKKELKEVTEYKKAISGQLRNLRETINKNSSKVSVEAVTDEALSSAVKQLEKTARDEIKRNQSKTKGSLLSFPTWVQAPTLIVSFNGITIGGYGNSGDKYPNYIESLEVNKVNGKINLYTINIIHQIRFGEDPNTIDKLLSSTGYLNKIKIKYGDSSVGMYYHEVEAVIREVTYSENPESSTINYTINALSSIGVADSAYSNYSSVVDKPSNVIRNLLYDNPNTSPTLLSSFPGMRDRQLVESLGLIPTSDSEVTIGGMQNVTINTYLTHVISCMHNELSTYYLNYIDDNTLGGSYFKITEISKQAVNDNSLANSYYVNIGYPSANNVLSFNVDEDVYFPMISEYHGGIKTYDYDVDNAGNIVQREVNNLVEDNFGNTGLAENNWWNFVTNYPIKASLTIQGLVNPIILMSDIYIDANYYGWTDYTSGIYKVTGQVDKISKSGCTSTLKLLKVTD